MNELLSSELWPRLRKLSKSARQKYAAVAYVTDDRFLKFAKGDVLVTDASDAAVESGQTSAAVLRAAWKRGASIFSVPGLHAKVYILGRHAIIGSANLSRSSERRTEAALLTDQPSIVGASRSLIRTLEGAGEPVDGEFVSRISKLAVSPPAPMLNLGTRIRECSIETRFWIVGLQPVEETEDEQAAAEAGMREALKRVVNEDSEVSWIRYRGRSRFRCEAKKDDFVIQVWSEGGKTHSEIVFRHAMKLRRQDEPDSNLTRFYIEEYSDSHQTTMTWKQFLKVYSRSGIPGKPSQWMCRELSSKHSNLLHENWGS